MDDDDKNLLIGLGGLALLGWLFKKDAYKCPRCNYPVSKKDNQCPNCGQPLNWGKF
ncbi:zinc-ribbon domain-containing protein [Methanococcoides sp. SA1]|nr:zinc-ribbon domain-containing protein [Methanococcoides sp. SA1]